MIETPPKKPQLNDLADALVARDLWMYLAWLDIRLRYRRSKIGPLWMTLSMAIFVIVLGAIYGRLFKADTTEFLPFLAVGYVIWGLISGLLVEFPTIFIDNAPYIKDLKINPLTILFRMTTRHVIIFAHNALIIVGIYIYFGMSPEAVSFLAIPGIALLVMNMVAIGITLSLVGARYRDISPIIQTMTQITFFITPIIWFPRLVSEDSWVLIANPFVYYLDITRAPVLGQTPSATSWLVSILTLVVFSLMAMVLYRKKAKQIPFWV